MAERSVGATWLGGFVPQRWAADGGLRRRSVMDFDVPAVRRNVMSHDARAGKYV